MTSILLFLSILSQAHKILLAANSMYFLKLFLHDAGTALTVIDHISATGISEILNYIYTARLKISIDNVQQILEAANYFQIESVIEACLIFLESELDVENCVDILIIAENFGIAALREKILTFISSNISKVATGVDFFRLDCLQIERLLSSDLTVDCEEKIMLKIILIWLMNDRKSNNKTDNTKLLQNIRFHDLSIDDVNETLKSLKIKNTDAYFHVVWNMMNPTNVHDNSLASGLVNYRGMNKALIKIGGFQKSGITNSIEYSFITDNFELDVWKHLTDIPHIATSCFASCIMNNCIYVIGGNLSLDVYMDDEGSVHPFGFKFCLNSNKWCNIKKMNVDRSRFSLNVLDSCLIAVGGIHDEDHEQLKSAEIYNSLTDEWHLIPSINFNLSQHAGCSYKNRWLFISGGIDYGGTVMDSFYCYDKETQDWIKLNNLSTPRCDHVSLIIEKKIYFVGGFNEISGNRDLVQIIEAYDIETKVFSYVTSIPSPRFHSGITNIGGDRIYVIGGGVSGGSIIKIQSLLN